MTKLLYIKLRFYVIQMMYCSFMCSSSIYLNEKSHSPYRSLNPQTPNDKTFVYKAKILCDTNDVLFIYVLFIDILVYVKFHLYTKSPFIILFKVSTFMQSLHLFAMKVSIDILVYVKSPSICKVSVYSTM